MPMTYLPQIGAKKPVPENWSFIFLNIVPCVRST